MRVAVSIVTYHTDLDELGQCLASLATPVVAGVTVIDNGSEQRIRDFVARYPAVRYIASDNVGYGAAHNLAMRHTLDRGIDYHLVLNSDVRFDPAVLERLVNYMDSHKDVGQVQPRITYPDGSLQYTVRRLPTPLDVFGRRFLPRRMFSRRNDLYTLAGVDHDREFDVAYHQGSFMLLRSQALKQTGLFDERFFMYPEDIDLTRRIHRRYRTVYYPAETIVHDHRAGSYHSWRLLRIHVVNMIRYFNKWGWWYDPERRRINRELDRLTE